MEVLVVIFLLSLPLVLLSWVLPEKWQLIPLSVGTAVFLGIYSPISLGILLGTGLISFYSFRFLSSLLAAMLIVVIQISAIFLFFKLEYGAYFGLSASQIIPLGLSYYSFRQIHYALEGYKQQLPQHTLLDYFRYLFFLPTILIGPINRFQSFHRDFQRRRWNSVFFSQGLERILYGFAKIIILGNYLFTAKLGRIINAFESDSIWLATYLKMVQFFANAYVQFSGFSDVAIGLSLLFGFRIIENFNFPFLASNIADFWNRWHISLSDWCRDYVYYPFLGMTRSSRISIIVSMLVLAGWHEISIRYLVWGAMHAIAINIWHQYKNTKPRQYLNRFPVFQKGLGIFITLHFVMLSFILTMENSMAESIAVYKILFGF